ncbi:MAG: hypothetical protein ACOX1Q_08795 [Eubacteriales bacterium]
MNRRKLSLAIIATLTATLIMSGGCNLLLSRDYMVITPHLENRLEEIEGNEMRAETFQELKNNILRLIEEGIEVGTIRLYNYTGDVDTDTETAITQTMKYEPLGVFAVEYVSYKSVRILSYHEITLTITYRKTAEEIAAIKKVDSVKAFRDLLIDAYSGYEDLLTVDIPWYYTDQYNVGDILQSYYDNNPLTTAAAPNFTMRLYPDAETEAGSGWQRILEISFDYPESQARLREMSRELVKQISNLFSDINLPTDKSKFKAIEDLLKENSVVISSVDTESEDLDVSGLESTAYGAIINKSATSEGYALAFKAMCDFFDIDCYVVRGRLDGLDHCWNLVSTEDGWYHVDVASDITTSSYEYLLCTDDQMTERGFRWNTSDYPLSASDVINAFHTTDEITQSELNEE